MLHGPVDGPTRAPNVIVPDTAGCDFGHIASVSRLPTIVLLRSRQGWWTLMSAMDRGSLHHKKDLARFRRLGVRPIDFVRAAEVAAREPTVGPAPGVRRGRHAVRGTGAVR